MNYTSRERRAREQRLKRLFITWVALPLLVILALKGLVVVSQFVGYATNSIDAQGGTITELVLEHNVDTDFWAGVFGIAVRVAGYVEPQWEDVDTRELTEKNLLFDCMQKDIEHEVYATTVDPNTLDLSTLYAMNPTELDNLYAKNTNDYDSATNTFTQVVTFEYGASSITAPGTITYKVGEWPPSTFQIALTKTGDGTPVYVAIITNFTKGFNNRTFNYQFLLPSPGNTTTRYHFFTDPNDVCTAGESEGYDVGHVYGHVTTTTGVPLSGVIVEVGGIYNLTDSTGFYSVQPPIGDRYIWAYKEGYNTYHNNVSVYENQSVQHDIILEEEAVVNPNTGIGPGEDNPGDSFNTQQEATTGGEEGGPGEAPLVPIFQQPKVLEGADYIISVSEINRRLRIGQFLQERVSVYSFKKNPAHVSFRLEGENISKLITVDTKELDVEPNSKGVFVLTIFGVAPAGIFNGSIILEGDLNATIPVEIEVLSREQLPVEALQINLETAEKKYYPYDVVRLKADMRNMLIDRQYPVQLLFTVQSPDGETTLWTYKTNAFIHTAFTLIKSFRLPSKVKAGDYVLRVTASYLGVGSSSSTIFHIAVPFFQRVFLGLKYWLWFLILLFIAAIVGGVYYYHWLSESKKKYHLKVEYDELPKPGPRSIPVGKIAETDNMTYFNLENFKTHTIVAGSTGGGKSVSAQVIIEEALDRGVAVIAFDPTAQWTGMLRPCKDKMMLSLYPLFGLKKSDAKAYNGNIRMITDPREKIDIKKYVKPGEIQVFCGHKLDPKDMDIMVANAIRQIFHANFSEEKLLKVLFVFDEVHRLLPKFGGSGDGFLQIERGCREFRKWGLGILLISQVLSDFVGTIKANINTEVQMRTRDEGDLERIRQKYGEEVLRSLVKATVGSGMVENPAYNRGKPYFVAFRPLKHSVERLTDEEIEQYNTYNDRIDNLFYNLEQLEAEKVDVFDLKLELKLALDKVKTGNFNMVKIYLEGLEPRIDKQWMTLGKKPKELVRELVEMTDIKDELAKAQQERDEYVAAKKREADAGAKPEEKKEWAWNDDVPPEKILNLKNGMIVINLASLYDELTAMKDVDLPKEFLPEPPEPEEGQTPQEPFNNFAEWVYTATGDTKLANAMAATKTKEELVKVLDKKKAGEDLGDVKAPEWFTKKVTATSLQQTAFNEMSKEPPVTTSPAQGATAPAANTATPALKTPASAQTSSPAQSAPASSTLSAPATPASAPLPTQQPVAQPALVQPIPAPVPVQQPTPQPSQEEEPTPQQAQGPVAAATSARQSLESLVVQNDGEAFKLENGMALKSVQELKEYIPQMDDGVFNNHVGAEYNHFADWIRGVFHANNLANKVASAHTKEELLAALS